MGSFQTPDRILAGLPRPPTQEGGMTIDEFIAAVLSGEIALDGEQTGPTVAPEAEEPSFEELFAEAFDEAVGPDPLATFQNIFSDILTGAVNTPLETFILSQFQDQLERFTTEARAAAERGEELPVFEQFLLENRPSLEQRFQFTAPGAIEGLDALLNLTGNIETPFSQFVISNFDRIFRDFTRTAGEAERAGGIPLEFPEFVSSIRPNLEQQFQFTRAGAQENFRDVQRLRQGANIAESPFEKFIQRGDVFDRLFGEFQRSDPSVIGSFGEFVGSVEERERTTFAALSPFDRGQFSSVGLGKRPVRIQP